MAEPATPSTAPFADRLLILAVRLVPLLMLAGVLALGWAIFAGVPIGWLAFAALFIVAAVVSRLGARRAGDGRYLAAWSASKGWTADEFEVRYLNSETGLGTLQRLVEHAAQFGYRLDAGLAPGPSDRFLRARLVREDGPST